MSDAPQPPPDEPRSISEALRLATSPSVAAMLRWAVAGHRDQVGLKELIAGALSVGAGERAHAPGGQPQFAGAFYDAVAAAHGQALVLPPAVAQPAVAQPGQPAPDAALSPMARQAIRQARLFSRLATGEDFIAARHLVTALTFPISLELRAVLRRVWRANWTIDVEALRQPLAAAMEQAIAERANDGRPEDRAAWRTLFGIRREVPAYTTDAPRPARIDPLGYAEEAGRLAELACLSANEPPMAVALFGDWGAGKSTFMNRMQAAVEDIGSTWRNDPRSPFCTRVAQVRFNAWSYADGDLWASLAAEIFRQRKGEIARLSGEAVADAQYRALLDRVALRFGAAEATSKEALGELVRLNRDLSAKCEELDQLDKRADQIAATPAAQRLQQQADALMRDKPDVVAKALGTLGQWPEDKVKQAITLVGEARQAVGPAGKLRLLGRLAMGLARKPWWAGLVAAGGVGAYFMPHLPAWAGAAAAALPALVARARPILQAADAFEKAEATERSGLAARRTALEAEIAGLRRQCEEKERDQTPETAFLARYAGAAGGESPAALLRFFLEQDSSLSEYEKRLGMVARLRESFETLQALLAEQGRTGSTALPAIDRIVLYVDDLDRCQPEQVVPVLQALALMLQLKLFVAVVAVDARWLNAALRIHYRDLIAEEAMTGPEQFLEKIFQIPFWLPGMQAGDINRYGAFVAQLVPEAVAKAAAGPDAGAGASGGADGTRQPPEARPDQIDPDELPQPGDADPFALPDRADTIERVSLTEPELNVLSVLAPLAGATPRAVKRYVNLYRLIRASRQGAALEAFLSGQDDAPDCAALAFALACACGLPAAASRQFLARLHRIAPQSLGVLAQSDAWQRESERDTPSAAAGKTGEPRPLDARIDAQLAAAAIAVEQATGRPLRSSAVAAAWDEAARFSFNRPG